MSVCEEVWGTENGACHKEECLAHFVQVGYLKEQREELWAQIAELTDQKVELAQQVTSLNCINTSQKKQIRDLEDHIEGYNEALDVAVDCHKQCQSKLEAEKQTYEKENIYLRDEIKDLIETNAQLSHIPTGGNLPDAKNVRIAACARLLPIPEDEQEQQALLSPLSSYSEEISESETYEVRTSLRDELLLADMDSRSEVDWSEELLGAGSSDVAPSCEHNKMDKQDTMTSHELQHLRQSNFDILETPIGSRQSQARLADKRAMCRQHEDYNIEHCAWSYSSTSVELKALHSYTYRHELVDVLAVVAAQVITDEGKNTFRLFLRDESRIEAPSVEAVIYKSDVAVPLDADVGTCILLKRFAVCFNGKKIPYVESRGGSAWCAWDNFGKPVCHGRSIRVSKMQSKEMQYLRKWWESQHNAASCA
ncbi:hypothetical protein GQ44DRAFT_776645 [Phaeosphaeriaceae sp. PMI808]|nr:hypothetical protein GQ44DRAFT_776645 [Phaeosphaeriaceae sp. PMI808]